MESIVYAISCIFLYNGLSFEYGNKAITNPPPRKANCKTRITIEYFHLPCIPALPYPLTSHPWLQ